MEFMTFLYGRDLREKQFCNKLEYTNNVLKLLYSNANSCSLQKREEASKKYIKKLWFGNGSKFRVGEIYLSWG